MSVYGTIRGMLREHTGGMKTFVDRLDRSGLPYLSYSKVACLEACPYRYLLTYVRRVPLELEPGYFVKGRIFHRGAARFYRARARGKRLPPSQVKRSADCLRGTDDHLPLCNAFEALVESAPDDLKVVAVEKPFVLHLERDLPPVVGVVDLVARSEGALHVVDHKTGKDFYGQKPHQMTLYAAWARKHYRAERVRAWYHQYRWVNSLTRIRKPAVIHTEVDLMPVQPLRPLMRFRRRQNLLNWLRCAWWDIQWIEKTGKVRHTGTCNFCPYGKQCDRYAPSSWWWGD